MKIEIRKIENEDGDYEQYDVIGAVLIIGDAKHETEVLAEAIQLDAEDDVENFKNFNELANRWQDHARYENAEWSVTKDASDLWFVLQI